MKTHSSIAIDPLLNMPARRLTQMCRQGVITRDDGSALTVDELLAELNQAKAKGYAVMPSGECDNYDASGRCQGHVEIAVTGN